MIEHTTTTKTEHGHLELLSGDVIDALNATGNYDIPDDAQVFVRVPGGGDYSNTRLDIDDGTEIIVIWEREVNE